jgi:hypothetical protein
MPPGGDQGSGLGEEFVESGRADDGSSIQKVECGDSVGIQ